MTEPGAALIWCPFPDELSARTTIAALLDERLIACGNLVPAMHSHFVWQGERGTETECGALLKTTAAALPTAMRRLDHLHPYEAPATMAWPVLASAETRQWLERETAA